MAGNNTIEVHITAENEKFVEKMRQVVDAIGEAKGKSERASTSFGGFGSSLANISMIVTGAYAGLSMLKTAIDGTIGSVMKYNMDMENNEAAFEVFLGNSQLATQYLNDLKKIAADTPFDLPGVTAAGKKLLAFGFDAQTSLKMLRTIGDASAGIGLGTEGIDRITLALGQIKAKGTVMGDEILQLTEAGIPAQEILAEKLHLTADQVRNIGDAGIDADTAIEALVEGMDDKFGGMAEKLSDKMMGLLSTIKDNVMNTGGFLMEPLFESVERGLAKVRDASDKLTAAINGQGDIDENAGVLRVIVKIQTGIEEATNLFVKFTELFGAYDDDGKFYFSEEALESFSKAGALLEQAGGFMLDIGDAMISMSPVAGEVLDRLGGWLSVLIRIADTIVNAVKGGADEANTSFGTTKYIVDLIVDALVGFFVLEKIITMAQALQTAFTLVRETVVAVRTAIKEASVAQAVLNALTGAMKGPVGLALAAAGTATAIGAGYAIRKSLDGMGDAQPSNGGKAEENYQALMQKLSNQKNAKLPYPGKKPSALEGGDNKKAVQAAQAAMKDQVQYLKDNLADQLEYFKDKMDEIELEFKQGALSIQEYYEQKEAVKQDETQARIDEIQAEIATVESAPYEHESDRQKELRSLNHELNKYTRQLEKITQTQKEIADVTLQAKQEEARVKALAAMGGPLDSKGQPQVFNNDDKSVVQQEAQIQQLLEEWGKGKGIDASYVDAVMNSSLKYGVDPRMALALMQQESGGNQDAVSPAGAIGLMQLMPETAASLGVDPYDAIQNIDGGIHYLADQLVEFGGDFTKAVAAYNAGAGKVQQYNGVPPYKETQDYVKSVQDNYGTMGYIPDLRTIAGALPKAYADAYAQADIINKQSQLTGRGYAAPSGNTYHGLDTRVIDVNTEDENVTNVSNMQDIFKNALNGVAKDFFEQTGQKLMLTGGAETGYHAPGEWGHEGGWKADIVNVGGFRDLFVKLAEKYGIAVGNEGNHYDLSGAQGGVGGTQITSNATGTLDQQRDISRIDARQLVNNTTLHNADSAEAFAKYEKDILDKLGIDLKLAQTMSKGMQQEMAIEAIKTAQEMRKYGSSDNAETRDKLQALYKENIYGIQVKYVKQDLELNVKDLQDSATKMGYRISLGLSDAKEAVEKYFGDFVDGIDGTTKKVNAAGMPKLDLVGNQIHALQEAMVHYQNNGGLKEYWSIKEEIDKVFSTLENIYKGWIQRIDDYAAFRTNLVENSYTMTTGQKDDAKKVIAAKKAKDEGVVQKAELQAYRNLLAGDRRELSKQQEISRNSKDGSPEKQDADSMVSVLNARIQKLQLITIPGLQESILLNKQLEKMPTLLEKVRQSSKQALEDGLVTFLTDGIDQADNLLEALGNLLTSILKSIQKVFAESITKNLMNQWFPVHDMDPLQNTGYNPSFGYTGDITKPFNKSGPSFLSGNNNAQNTGYDDHFGYSGNLLDGFTQQTGQLSGVLSKSVGYASTFISQGNAFLQSIDEFAIHAITTLQSAATKLSGASGTTSASGTAYTFAVGNLADVARKATGGAIDGPGTETSDSIPIMASKKEYMVRAAAHKKYGTPMMNALNNGRLYEYLQNTLGRINNGTFGNIRVKVPKFARGGAIGSAGSSAANRFTADFGANISTPVNLTNNTYVDGHRIFDAYGQGLVRSEVRKEMVKNAKLHSEIGKRMR